MLRDGTPNPLNVHQLRRVHWCPPHFTPVVFDRHVNERDILAWLYENLEGRFYLGDHDEPTQPLDPTLDPTHVIISSDRPNYNRRFLVAFERSSEASYFALLLPQINPPADF